MELFKEEVEQLEKAVANHPTQSVVFYGSSTIRRWTTLEQDFPQAKLINLGFGGSTLGILNGW